uniref:Uncharacterized protein n=1 Tax=Arundo donax TaxID=35708 RepID=A0A0A9H1X0_ARUDO
MHRANKRSSQACCNFELKNELLGLRIVFLIINDLRL